MSITGDRRRPRPPGSSCLLRPPPPAPPRPFSAPLFLIRAIRILTQLHSYRTRTSQPLLSAFSRCAFLPIRILTAPHSSQLPPFSVSTNTRHACHMRQLMSCVITGPASCKFTCVGSWFAATHDKCLLRSHASACDTGHMTRVVRYVSFKSHMVGAKLVSTREGVFISHMHSIMTHVNYNHVRPHMTRASICVYPTQRH
jgi:hypothetical protein